LARATTSEPRVQSPRSKRTARLRHAAHAQTAAITCYAWPCCFYGRSSTGRAQAVQSCELPTRQPAPRKPCSVRATMQQAARRPCATKRWQLGSSAQRVRWRAALGAQAAPWRRAAARASASTRQHAGLMIRMACAKALAGEAGATRGPQPALVAPGGML
jgi:hypothetical protein